jgi:D-xylose transport system permease protein
MTEAIQGTTAVREPRRSAADFLHALEVDTRLLGLIVATAYIWVLFSQMSDGLFLSPRNLWNLSVQSAAVAIMATGMVLVIVSRNIDLSIGSTLGFTGMFMAMIQAEWIPKALGLGFQQPYTWIVALALGLAAGALIGLLQGFIIAYVGVPSFIVTLGGLLVWRGAAFQFSQGQTIAPMDGIFALLGGGPKGSLGGTLSWVVAGIAIVAIIYGLWAGRRRRRKYGFPVRPMWAEVLLGVLGVGITVGAVWIANSYPWPENLAQQYAQENNIAIPEGGLIIPTGIANPVLIAIGATIVMTFLATRRRFGRYVYSIGGNPDAAELAGINTRRTIMGTFVLMGVLAALSGAVLSARLNAATVGTGTQAELYVIAAAVIGGTSFAGGIGTIPGAVLGAVFMQSLQSGMVLLKVDSPVQDIVVGVVLVLAVAFDTILRRQDVKWARLLPALCVFTGVLSLLGALVAVTSGAGGALLVMGLVTIVISIATILWPLVERSRPGSGQILGAVGGIAAIVLIVTASDNLNILIAGAAAGLYATIAFATRRAVAQTAATGGQTAGA